MNDTMRKCATLSECGQYRYVLQRIWGSSRDVCTFIMLNPSTADAEQDDPTIRKCMGFARLWGYDGIRVVNLFAFRATNPKAMFAATDPIGPANDRHLLDTLLESGKIVCAWGRHGDHRDRAKRVLALLQGAELCALKLNNDGSPAHPLYQPYGCQLSKFGGRQ